MCPETFLTLIFIKSIKEYKSEESSDEVEMKEFNFRFNNYSNWSSKDLRDSALESLFWEQNFDSLSENKNKLA